jgi:hypothetical protein
VSTRNIDGQFSVETEVMSASHNFPSFSQLVAELVETLGAATNAAPEVRID